MRKLKTVSSKYELYLLQLLSCKLLALLSAMKLLSDRAKRHVHRQANANDQYCS